MPQVYNDALFCSTFVIVLLALIGLRRTAFKDEQDAYLKIVLGMLFLTGFSVIQLLGNQNAFAGIKYIEEPMNRKMVEAIGVVGGLIFLLTGIGSWLPSLRERRKVQASLNKRYYCLKMINQGIEQHKSMDECYANVMQCLTTYLGLPRTAAFSYSTRQDALFLSGASGFTVPRPEGFRRLSLTETHLKQALMQFRVTDDIGSNTVFDGGREPDLVIPVSQNRRLYGALFCWTGDAVKRDDDLSDFLGVVGELLGRHAQHLVTQSQREFYSSQRTAFDTIGRLCSKVSSVQQLMPSLFKIIGEVSGAEFMSTAVLDASGENMMRYSIGSSGRLLLEKGVSRPTRGTEIKQVFDSGMPIIRSIVDSENRYDSEDGLFLSCGMHSKITCPVTAGSQVLAVVTLGHTRAGFFTASTLHTVGELVHLMAAVIQREQLRRTLEVKEDQMLRLQLMERQLLSDGSIDAFFDDACAMLTRRMKCTMARVSLVEPDRKNLASRACRSLRDVGQNLRPEASLPLSLMPWHRMILDAQKVMLINQDDMESRMQVQESTQALLPDIKSAILVPIKMDDRVQGIISIGEVRNWNRRTFKASDLIIAKDVAAKCSVALRLRQLEDRARRAAEKTSTGISLSDRDFVMQLKSPLTSIMGAVELLQMKGNSEDEFSSRYHNLILKSADRIKAMTDTKTASLATEFAEAIEPEVVIG